MAIYVEPGYLLYSRQRTLMAQQFDLRRLELAGEATAVAENIRTNDAITRWAFSASDNGVLIFRSGEANRMTTRLTWFDRAGNSTQALGEPGFYNHPQLSHDATRVAF